MKKILSLLAVAAMAFTACTTDITEDVVKNEAAEYSVPLEFAVEQEETRAFMDDNLDIRFEEGDEFGVYVTPADATAEVTKNAKGTIVNKDGALTVQVQVASFAAGDTVMAYYPYYAGNDNQPANDIYMQNQNVQIQEKTDRVNLKNMPMMSVATKLESATEGSILFRPVASLVKLNIYSSITSKTTNAGKENEKTYPISGTIEGAKFHAEKWQNVSGCNWIADRRAHFDLTSVTENSEIVLSAENHANCDGDGTFTGYVDAWRAWAYYSEGTPIVSSVADAEPLYICVWPGTYGGPKFDNANSKSQILIYTSAGRFDIVIPEQYEFGRGMIRPFNIDLAKCDFKVPVDVAYLRTNATAAGISLEQFLVEDLIVIGSGAECDNIASNPLVGPNGSKEVNKLTAYAQTLDGKYGFRLDFTDAKHNSLKRGDKISLMLLGAKTYNPNKGNDAAAQYFYIGGLQSVNIHRVISGCEDEIVVKEKALAELTDADIFTEVTLTDMEMFVKKTVQNGTTTYNATGYNEPAPFTFGLESNFTATAATTGYNAATMHTMMQDKDNNAIMALINPQCGEWRRNVGVPQGVGSVKGVIVHETSNTIGDVEDGNMGKYQFRPYGLESFSGISTEEESATKVIAMWSLLKATNSINNYKFTCDDEGCLGTKRASGYQEASSNAADPLYKEGLVPTNKMWATHGELTDGSALFYSTNNTFIDKTIHYWYSGAKSGNLTNKQYPVGLLAGLKTRMVPKSGGGTDGKSQSPFTTIVFHSSTAGFYEWNEGTWTGKTKGFIVEFPGSAATGKTAVAFAINPSAGALARENWFGYPINWKVECSVDGGTTWTACTNAITGNAEGHFDMHNFNYYLNGCAYFLPGKDGAAGKATGDFNVYFNGLTPRGVMSQGYSHQKFILPESAQGAGKVMVKISPRSTQLAWPANGVWNPSLTNSNVHATADLVHGHRYSFEDVMVTTVK